MKKLVTIFALFTLVMLTSFVEPNEVGGRGTVSTGNYEVGGRGRGTVSTGNYEVGGRGTVSTGNYEVGGRGTVSTGN